MPMSIAYVGQARPVGLDRPMVRPRSTPHQAVLESQEERQQQWQLLILAKEVWRRDAALAPRERGRAHISVRILFGTNQALIRPALDAAHLWGGMQRCSARRLGCQLEGYGHREAGICCAALCGADCKWWWVFLEWRGDGDATRGGAMRACRSVSRRSPSLSQTFPRP